MPHPSDCGGREFLANPGYSWISVNLLSCSAHVRCLEDEGEGDADESGEARR